MKLLFENWRKFLLNEGMMSLKTLPENVFIRINKEEAGSGSGWPDRAYTLELVEIQQEAGEIELGQAAVDRVNISQDVLGHLDREAGQPPAGCNLKLFENLYTLHLDFEKVEGQGYGPLFMDLAMELAASDGKRIIPATLVGGMGSGGARKLYNIAYYKRADIDAEDVDDACLQMWGVQRDPQLDMFPASKPMGYTELRYERTLPPEFLALYTKSPTILNSPLAKTKIIWTEE